MNDKEKIEFIDSTAKMIFSSFVEKGTINPNFSQGFKEFASKDGLTVMEYFAKESYLNAIILYNEKIKIKNFISEKQ